MEDTDEEGDEDEGKKMKMMMRGKKERKMKEKMINGTLKDSNLFKFSPVLGSKFQSFSPPSCAQVSLFLRSFFSPLHHGSHLIWGGGTLSRIQWEKNLWPFLFQILFYPFLS